MACLDDNGESRSRVDAKRVSHRCNIQGQYNISSIIHGPVGYCTININSLLMACLDAHGEFRPHRRQESGPKHEKCDMSIYRNCDISICRNCYFNFVTSKVRYLRQKHLFFSTRYHIPIPVRVQPTHVFLPVCPWRELRPHRRQECEPPPARRPSRKTRLSGL